VRVLAFPEVGNGELGADEGASRVDRLDEIEALDIHVLNTDWVDGASVVDKNINTAKCLNCLVDCSLNTGSIANIALDGQSATTCLFNLLSGRVNCAFQIGLLGHGLGGNGDVGTVSGAALCDLEADSS